MAHAKGSPPPVRHIARYGWVPDLPDHRDHKFAAPAAIRLPPHADLRAKCPAVYDQDQLGSCVANAVAFAVQFDRLKLQLPPDWVPSRLFNYYQSRVIEHSVGYDSGATLRDGIKVAARLGSPPEADWPYDISAFTHKPPQLAYTDALEHQAIEYKRIAHNLHAMKACLAAGYPWVLGFSVYESFESDLVARTGVVPMPGPREELLGGHAVACVGYDEPSQRFIVRNSWGASWGQHGYFTMPYAYLKDSNLADDFWTIRTVEA